MKTITISILLLASTLLFSCSGNTKFEPKRKCISKPIIDNTSRYLEKGKAIAQKTGAVLGENLKLAIESKGVNHALSFCNQMALQLTDSMAKAENVGIKRVSLKNRNPVNTANKSELDYFLLTETLKRSGKKITPQLKEVDDKMVAYYPIFIQNKCLQCHGDKNKDIKKSTLTKIKNLYENDKATGYKVGDLRGIWVITMDKDN